MDFAASSSVPTAPAAIFPAMTEAEIRSFPSVAQYHEFALLRYIFPSPVLYATATSDGYRELGNEGSPATISTARIPVASLICEIEPSATSAGIAASGGAV